MTITELLNSDKISHRCFTFCKRNGLIDTFKILDHYRNNQSFKNIKYCSKSIDVELSDFCLNHYIEKGKYFLESISELDTNVLTLNRLLNSGLISVRSYNVCDSQGLNHINSILDFFLKYKTFNILKNCGNKSDKELSLLCIEYIERQDFNFSQPKQSEKSIINVISNLTRTQREIINSYIEIAIKKLSNKSNKSICLFLENNLTIRNITDKIFSNENFNFINVNNIGSKTTEELSNFIDSIAEFTSKVSVLENESQLIALNNRIFIEKTFAISSIPNEILESQSIFSIVDFLINKDSIFDKNENIIFQKAFKIYDKQPVLTLDDIAKEINISLERVRQIRKSIAENLFNNFLFIRNIEDDVYQKYNIDQNQLLINIEDDLNNLINDVNRTNFSNEFNSFIIYTYISDKFDLIGEIKDVLLPKYFNSKERHNWDNFYLVNKKISSLFNFNDFANDLDRRLSERIEESYIFNFKSYLLSFLKSTNFDVINNTSEVAEKILNNEFGIYIDTNDNIKFNRNSLKQVHEYAYEALELLGKPSKVNEITKKIEELHPDYETNESKVRVSMKSQNGFVPIGRSSIFALKAWENQFENFKGGTIRSIVSEYLESEIKPKHISEIAEYVLNYRPNTYERSILDNLKADGTKTFIFFKNSTIGLKSKKYDKLFVELKQIDFLESKSWEERYNDFIKFISINNRLPFSSGCPDEEIRLYRWYKVQEGKIKNKKLNTEKSNLLNQVTIRFKRNDTNRKRRSNNAERYIELKQFVLLKKRLPSVNKIGEEKLYHFFYKKRKMFEQGELEQSEENQFIEIAKLIETHKYENKRN